MSGQPESSTPEPGQNSSSYYDHIPSPEHLAAMRYLNLPELHLISDRDMSNLNEVVNWAKTVSKSEDRLDVLSAIRWLEGRLGAPKVGESRVENLYRWIRLDQEETKLTREKKLYER